MIYVQYILAVSEDYENSVQVKYDSFPDWKLLSNKQEENTEEEITINVSVVYMARKVMILMWANPLPRPLEGVGPEFQDFFGPKNE